MPHRRPPALRDNATPTARANFRQRYDELEAQRAALIARLRKLSKDAHQHPSYKRALKLLNGTFRRSKLGQRLAVLEAATWLIDVLEWIIWARGVPKQLTVEGKRQRTILGGTTCVVRVQNGVRSTKCGRLITDA